MIGPAIAALCATALIAIAAYGLGRLAFGRVLAEGPRYEAAALAFVAGSGLIGLLLFLVGLLTFGPLAVAIVLAPGAVLGGRYLIADGRRSARPGLPARPGIALLCAATVVAILVAASLAPLAGDFGHDGIAYHVLGPALWLREGHVVIAADEARTAFPATVEALFGAGMALSSDRAARLVGVLFLVAVLCQVAGFARRLGASPAYATLAAGLTATMPLVTLYTTEAFVDVPFAAFSLGALALGLAMTRTADAILVGALLGFTMATKYTGIIVVAVTLLTLLLFLPREVTLRQRLAWCVIAGSVAVAVAVPWYIHTFVVMGSPIYPPPPGLSGLVTTPHMSADVVAAFHQITRDRGAGFGTDPVAFLILPFTFTFFTATFHGAGGIGIAPLAFGPIAMVRLARQTFARGVVFWNLCLVAAWFATTQEARYMIHVAACCAALAAYGAEIVLARWRGLARAPAYAALGLSLAYGTFAVADRYATSVLAVVSPSAADRRLTALIPYRDVFDAVNRADSVGVVLVVDSVVPSYYIAHPFTKLVGGFGEQAVPGVRTLSDALAAQGRIGFTHVITLRTTLVRQPASTREALDTLYAGEDAVLVRVRRSLPPSFRTPSPD